MEPLQEDEGYRRYQKLEQELGQIPVWDDRFEAVLDEMEELQEQLPKGMELMKDAKEQLQKLRGRKAADPSDQTYRSGTPGNL
ncbi:hypothetical protein [Mediterraneibacter gnavus]|uniref:hypothetical protein n=1 Tax=Mediterraneibacter gnavus TaxID=33038 RepID=UPI0036D36DA4